MFGRGYRYRWLQRMPITSDYRYVGPCLCGFGPHTFYQGRRGRFVHAWNVESHVQKPLLEKDLKSELEDLKVDKADIEKQIEELEKLITNKEKKE